MNLNIFINRHLLFYIIEDLNILFTKGLNDGETFFLKLLIKPAYPYNSDEGRGRAGPELGGPDYLHHLPSSPALAPVSLSCLRE